MMKRVVERRPLLASTFWSVAFGVPVYLLILAAGGVPPLKPGFGTALAAAVLLNVVTLPLRNLALRLSPLSLTIPYLAFTPLFLLFTESLMLGDRPGTRGVIGVILVVVGAWTLQLKTGGSGPRAAFAAFAREPGSLIMLGVAAIWSVTSVLDKICVTRSSPAFYVATFNLGYTVLALPILLILRRPLRSTARGEWRLLALVAASHVISLLAQMVAIRLALVSYVIAIKRSGMLLSVLIGAVAFGERPLAPRLAGAAIMSSGVVLILTG
jgi:drug/metabolite transporter (DMT)-like permease